MIKPIYDEASKLLNRAIDMETQGNCAVVDIINVYEQGKQVLLGGLSLKPNSQSNEVELQLKMKRYLEHVEQRLYVLRSKQPSVIKTLDKDIANMVLNQILEQKPNVKWEDISGLREAKRALQELVILPSLRPDLYSGLRSPQRGLLLFGPPGTGKTLLAKAVAHEAKAKFFALSASSLLSKFYGESEKIVKTVFALAKELQPSILFFDEVDSILSRRSSDGNEHESSRRLKTEFLVQFDGVGSGESSRVIVLGATNRPQELDEAARRRFPRRIYVGLPDPETRRSIFTNLLCKIKNKISSKDTVKLVNLTEGYSCSDITALCKEASLCPLRDLSTEELKEISQSKIRPIVLQDFLKSIETIRASVSRKEVDEVEEWGRIYGERG